MAFLKQRHITFLLKQLQQIGVRIRHNWEKKCEWEAVGKRAVRCVFFFGDTTVQKLYTSPISIFGVKNLKYAYMMALLENSATVHIYKIHMESQGYDASV